MSLTVSLSTLAFSVTTLADNHNMSMTQLTGFINQGYSQLYDKLTDAAGEDYNLSVTSFTTTASVSTYALNTYAPKFYKLRGIDIQYSGNLWIALKPFIWKDRNLYQNTNLYAGTFGPVYRYRLNGSNLLLTPIPSGGQTIRIWYVPTITLLAATSDTIDGVNGWEQWIINFAAIQCLINNEQDPSPIVQQQMQIEARIAQMAASRDQGEPQIVAAASDDTGNPYSATGVMGPPGGGWGDF